MTQYIQVSEDEHDEPIEIPSETDGTLLLSTLAAQYPGACGLKYRNPSTGNFRGVRLNEGLLYPPDNQWGEHVYIVVFPKDNKRKGEEQTENPSAKTKKLEKKCSDLIVLGLPYKSTEEDLKTYFSKYGELVLAQVKIDPWTQKSKGFGFIRFHDYDAQLNCLAQQRHMIDGRWCEVNIPNSNEAGQQTQSRKIFVARISEGINTDDLHQYFSKFGSVVDAFIPKPFRAFGFVTFGEPDVATALCGEDHIIKGCSVHVSIADPKTPSRDRERGDRDDHRRDRGDHRGDRGRDYRRDDRDRERERYDRRERDGRIRKSRDDHRDQPMTGINEPVGMNGMNFLNSAMLAAAQAVLSGQAQGGWGGMPSQNAGGADLGPGYGGTLGSKSDSNRSYSGWGTSTGYDTGSSSGTYSTSQTGGYSGWGGGSSSSRSSGWN
ncbi:TARDBP [Mytilus coruscus]|uniref:TARDBP n=1 Tax=Mytilus coruscus TaxID=42192 RepID=A0A6J8A647_MYTCO|nr:TARDBP [Mytilus coruscus]